MNASNPLVRGAVLALAIVMLTFTVIQAQGCQDAPPPKATPKKPTKKVDDKKEPAAAKKAPEKKADDKKAPESKPADGKKADGPKKLKLDPTFMPATKSGVFLPATKSGGIDLELRKPGMLKGSGVGLTGKEGLGKGKAPEKNQKNKK